MPFPPGRFIVDAHEDLACHCQEFGRRLESTEGCSVPVMITLPRLQELGVRLVCATLFVPHELGHRERLYKLFSQYEMYLEWFSTFSGQLRLIKDRAGLAELAAAEPAGGGDGPRPIGLILLMEGLDLLTSAAELATWHDRGVRMASITWNGKNIFASGCYSDGAGLTAQGYELLGEFQRLGLILDLAHLNDAGIADVFRHYEGPVCATHSNAREIADHQRNLTNHQLQELARRQGVVGLNMLAPLVQAGWRKDDALPALHQAAKHVEHIARLIGPEHTGLGSDLDGGLTPQNTPAGIETVSDLPLIFGELAEQGWDEDDLEGFAGRNWWGFFERALPA